MTTQTVTGYSFRPADLGIASRKPGISAFMRCRNGADFVEATIRSHMAFYDEIVVTYNQCTDATPDILERLRQEFAPKLRLFHYTDRVHPLGSHEHAKAAPDSPNSMVNYSNFALSRTRCSIVVKLDDDHLAIPSEVSRMVADLREGRADRAVQHCFSGFNIAHDIAHDGAVGVGIPAFDPVVGGGDHGYFEISEATRFYYDRRFERFGHRPLKRRFAGFFYWHLKYLKEGQGFVNYELGANPDSRYMRKKRQFEQTALISLPEAAALMTPKMSSRLAALASEKSALKLARNRSVGAMFPDRSLEAALDRLSPGWRAVVDR